MTSARAEGAPGRPRFASLGLGAPGSLVGNAPCRPPVEDTALKAELLDVLERCFADNASSWELDSDGVWARRQPDGEVRSAQEELMARHSARAAEHLAGPPTAEVQALSRQ